MTQIGRKRARACEDESCEFTPISKRINNLHIRSGFITSDDEGPDENGCNNSLQQKENCQQNHSNHLLKHPTQIEVASTSLHECRTLCELHRLHNLQDNFINGSSTIINPTSGRECDSFPSSSQMLHHNPSLPNGYIYNPELSASANPHYYQINGLLYGLHINRLQRLGKLSSN